MIHCIIDTCMIRCYVGIHQGIGLPCRYHWHNQYEPEKIIRYLQCVLTRRHWEVTHGRPAQSCEGCMAYMPTVSALTFQHKGARHRLSVGCVLSSHHHEVAAERPASSCRVAWSSNRPMLAISGSVKSAFHIFHVVCGQSQSDFCCRS